MPDPDEPATEGNRAADPGRRYRSDRETHLDLVLLLKNRPAEQKAVLNEIIDCGNLIPTAERSEAARWLNKWAESFGFVPMLEQSQGQLRFTSGAHEPVRRALADPQASPSTPTTLPTTPDPTGQGPDPSRNEQGTDPNRA